MPPPMDEISAGHMAPAKAVGPASVKVHQMVPAVGVKRAVGIAGDADILGYDEMITGAIGIA